MEGKEGWRVGGSGGWDHSQPIFRTRHFKMQRVVFWGMIVQNSVEGKIYWSEVGRS